MQIHFDFDSIDYFVSLVRNLGKDRTMQFIESESLRNLIVRMSTYNKLRNKHTHFYTLEELHDLAISYQAHLKSNKTHLIRTGHPETTFEKSRWLDWQLNKIYFTKLPLFDENLFKKNDSEIANIDWNGYPNSSKVVGQVSGNYRYEYKWANEDFTEEMDIIEFHDDYSGTSGIEKDLPCIASGIQL